MAKWPMMYDPLATFSQLYLDVTSVLPNVPSV